VKRKDVCYKNNTLCFLIVQKGSPERISEVYRYQKKMMILRQIGEQKEWLDLWERYSFERDENEGLYPSSGYDTPSGLGLLLTVVTCSK